jgi:hypothetical protein
MHVGVVEGTAIDSSLAAVWGFIRASVPVTAVGKAIVIVEGGNNFEFLLVEGGKL